MISYSANREDVLLQRLFPLDYIGFYIDVGAADPVIRSVTKHFYDRGWRGINVEPSSVHFPRLSQDRPEDINLHAGLSNRSGTLDLYEFSGEFSELSTFSKEQAMVHKAAGLSFRVRTVEITTLKEVCEKYGVEQIDFMSVDVDGHELEVLEGGDWSRWRPRVLVIEATQPNTTIETSHKWEHILIRAQYSCAAFDGLNRYYVRREDQDLAAKLSTPVSLHDKYETIDHISRLEALKDEIRSLSGLLSAGRLLRQASERRGAGLCAELDRLHASLAAVTEQRNRLERQVDEMTAKQQEAEVALRDLDQLGPTVILVARKLQVAGRKFPRTARLAGAMVRRLAAVRRLLRTRSS